MLGAKVQNTVTQADWRPGLAHMLSTKRAVNSLYAVFIKNIRSENICVYNLSEMYRWVQMSVFRRVRKIVKSDY